MAFFADASNRTRALRLDHERGRSVARKNHHRAGLEHDELTARARKPNEPGRARHAGLVARFDDRRLRIDEQTRRRVRLHRRATDDVIDLHDRIERANALGSLEELVQRFRQRSRIDEIVRHAALDRTVERAKVRRQVLDACLERARERRGRVVQHALLAVDDERPLARHQRNLSEVDLLLLHVSRRAIHELHRELERRGPKRCAQKARLARPARRLQRVRLVKEHAAADLDGKRRAKDAVKPVIAARGGRDVGLETLRERGE